MTAVNWAAYRKCPVCMAEAGNPCLSLLGLIRGAGRIEEPVEAPHSGRKLRTGYGR